MKLPALAHAQKWLAAHHTQALAAGGAGVVGFALYKRHQNAAGGTGTTTSSTTPAGGSSIGTGDPGSAGSTLSDVDAALLDSDLTGISGQLDGIKNTLANLNPLKRTATAKKPKPAKAKKAKRPPVKKAAPKHTKPPATKTDQHRRFSTAARKKMKALPNRPATGQSGHKAPTANPRPVAPVGRRVVATPVTKAVAGKRTLAAASPKPARKTSPTRPVVPRR